MKRYSLLRVSLASVLVALAVVTCTDGSLTGPKSGRGLLARLGFAPAFTQAATEIFQNIEAFGFEVNNVHVHLDHANGRTAKDTTIVIGPGQDSVVIQVSITLDAAQEELEANIELRDDNTVLFSGTQRITAKAGGSSPPSPPIPVDYTGPGATATTLTVTPKDTAVLAGDSIAFRPSAKDNNGQNVASLALAWSVKDPAFGLVNGAGVFRASPLAGRGGTYVHARLLSGPKDSAFVNVVPKATKVVLISGGDQAATVGTALAQSIVVEAQAADNLPAPFTPLTFSVASGGGSVSRETAFADAAGRATVALTLGTTAGTNAFQAGGTGLTPALISATGIAAKAAKLAIGQQPSAIAPSGTAFATQPAVQVKDAFGNAVAAANIAVTASLTAANGRTLGGTLTVNTNPSGVAQFTDLQIAGPPGTATLTFSQDTLSSAVSNSIEITLGAAATIVAVAGDGVGLLKGEETVLRARVTDAGGNNVSGAGVTFTVISGGGLLNSATVPFSTTTGTDGTANVDWNVGTSGAQLVRASVGASSVDFTAFIAETLVVVRQPTLTPQSGVLIPTQPKVQLRDLQGNQVKRAGVLVLVNYQRDPALQDLQTALAGALQQTTDANGDAAWTDLVIAGQTSPTIPQTVKLAFAHGAVTPTINPTFSAIMSLGVGPVSLVAAETGDPYYRFDPGTSIAPVGVRVTDGFNPIPDVSVDFFDDRGTCPVSSSTATTDASGIASVNLTLSAALTSCAIRAQTQGTPPIEQIAFLRVYVVGTGTPFWTGKTDSEWTTATNWYAGITPSAGGTAFIPAGWLGLDGIPTLSADIALASLSIEAGALMDLNTKVLTLSQDLAADGYLFGGGTVVVDGASGALRAGFIEGLLKIGPSADYSVSGFVAVDSLEVNNALRLDQEFFISVSGAMRTKGSGQLFQSKGSIIVQGDATFDGQVASLTGGSLTVGRNFTFNGACESKEYVATAAHVTQMIGDATTDTLRLTWNAGCVGGFAILHILTQGESGVLLRTDSTSSQSLPVQSLMVGIGAKLNVSTPIFVNIAPLTGTLSLADPSSLLRIENILSIPPSLLCTATALLQGDNFGPRSCTMP